MTPQCDGCELDAPGPHASHCPVYAAERRKNAGLLYTSDTHLSHANIITYCRRPFRSKEHMDAVLMANLQAAEQRGARLVHCGDLCFDFARFVAKRGPLWGCSDGHTIVLGNHDHTNTPAKRLPYEQHFEYIAGTERAWRDTTHTTVDYLDGVPVVVLLSHAPQWELHGCDVNVHGHLHNNSLAPGEGHHPEFDWTLDSPVHFNASVELHDYKPVSLDQLANAHHARYT